MPRQLTRLSAWPGFRRSLRPAAANHTVCSESRPGLHHRNPARSLILQHIDARLSAGDSSVSRKREAAIVGARRTGFTGDRVDIVRVDVSSPRSYFRALAAGGFRFYPRPAATRIGMGAVGRRGALIFEGFRARLRRNRPRWLQAGPSGLLSKTLGARHRHR